MKKLLALAVTLVTAAGISIAIATASPSRGGDHVVRGAPAPDVSCAARLRASAFAYFREQERPTLDQALAGIRSSALRYLTAQEGLTLDQALAGIRSSALQYFRSQEALTLEQASSAAALAC